MRPELSMKNEFRIEKHRYYELKHFCLQYPIWKEAYNSLNGLSNKITDPNIFRHSNDISNQTERIGVAMASYSKKMNMITETAEKVDKIIAPYLVRGVTRGESYDAMRMRCGVPCCRDTYYELYRQFFYELNRVRD